MKTQEEIKKEKKEYEQYKLASEMCRVPEGETPITWEGLGTGIIAFLFCFVFVVGVVTTVLWVCGEVEFFPAELGCNNLRVRTLDKPFHNILNCSDGRNYVLDI